MAEVHDRSRQSAASRSALAFAALPGVPPLLACLALLLAWHLTASVLAIDSLPAPGTALQEVPAILGDREALLNILDSLRRMAVIVELAGTAAHELNQPLTSVMGYADLLKRKLKEDDFAYRPVDIIYREAERMAEIVRKIGKITRYETKSYVGTAKILDLDKATSHED